MVGTRSVLVVEPADDDRGGIARTLHGAGLVVESAADAGRASESIVSNRHAMVLVNPLTPGLTSAGLAEALRQTAPRPVVLVVIDDFAPVRRGFGADVIHGYIRRDTEGGQLAELIRDCLAALRESNVGRPDTSPNRRVSDRV
jgi:CheY-like chemotaxis protein